MNYNSEQQTPKSRVFNEAIELKRRKRFSNREVGITHPDNSGFIRIADSGEVEIFAAPGVGLIINPNTRSISFFADSIKFFTREDDGLRWNEKSFNPASDVYNEPTFVKTNEFLHNPAYYRSTYYLDNLDLIDQNQGENPITIMANYGLGLNESFNPIEESSSVNSDLSTLTLEQRKLVDDYSVSNSEENVQTLINLLSLGYSFQQAVEKIKEGDLNNPLLKEEYINLRNNQEK